jgi:hypothetical protein
MNPEKQAYIPPLLEQHQQFTVITGGTFRIGPTALDNPLELDFMEGEK